MFESTEVRERDTADQTLPDKKTNVKGSRNVAEEMADEKPSQVSKPSLEQKETLLSIVQSKLQINVSQETDIFS